MLLHSFAFSAYLFNRKIHYRDIPPSLSLSNLFSSIFSSIFIFCRCDKLVFDKKKQFTGIYVNVNIDYQYKMCPFVLKKENDISLLCSFIKINTTEWVNDT